MVSVGRGTAISAAEAMLGARPEELNRDVVDAIGELTNMIAGRKVPARRVPTDDRLTHRDLRQDPSDCISGEAATVCDSLRIGDWPGVRSGGARRMPER